MSVEHVRLVGGRIVPLGDLRSRYSLSIYQTEQFYSVCEFMAARETLATVRHKVLVNLYALKSQRVRDLAALVYFLSEEGDCCEHLEVHEDAVALLRHFAPASLSKLVSLGARDEGYVSRSTVLFIALKIILHRVFRLFGRNLGGSSSMVRGWVDVTAAMYPQQMADAQVCLYPFPYGILRQWRFYRDCRRQGLNVGLAGLAYSWSGFFRLLCSRQPSASQVVGVEVEAYERYAQELVSSGISRLYTSDEFEIAGVALYEKLIAAGIEVVNTAHGVGLYAPHVAYSEFRGVNLPQAQFYRVRCSELRPTVRDGKNLQLPLARAEEVRHLAPSIVLLDQNFLDFQCLAEAQALARVEQQLELFSARMNVPLFIKVHPNSKDEPSNARSGAAPRIRQWQGLGGHRPIFITVNSTAFYDVQGHGPMLVCDERSFFPEIYFGDDLDRYTLDDLESQVARLLDPDNWYEAARQHETRGCKS